MKLLVPNVPSVTKTLDYIHLPLSLVIGIHLWYAAMCVPIWLRVPCSHSSHAYWWADVGQLNPYQVCIAYSDSDYLHPVCTCLLGGQCVGSWEQAPGTAPTPWPGYTLPFKTLCAFLSALLSLPHLPKLNVSRTLAMGADEGLSN